MTDKDKDRDVESTDSGLWMEFSGSTGFHGINKLIFQKGNSKQIFRSIIWAILFLISAGLLIFIMATEMINYYSYPTLTTTYVQVKDPIPFPTITVCSSTPIDTDTASLNFDQSWQNENDKLPVVNFLEFVQFSNKRYGGECRRFNVDGSLTTKKFGPQTGFHLEIKSSEIEFMVHDSREEPDIVTTARTIRNGTETFIEIHRREYKSLPSPYTSHDNKVCRKASRYSYYECRKECYKDILRQKCGCIMDTNPAEGERYCLDDYDDRTCTDTLSLNLELEESLDPCDCPQECDVIKFDQIISTLANKDDGYQHWLKVHIYLKDLTATVTEQLPKYDGIISLLANLGGQMGLFIGASLLTIVEVLEFVWFLIFAAINRRTYRNNSVKNIS